MTSPYFLNVSMIFFLFLFNSGPGICFTTDIPSSQYNPKFSLCKTSQSFVKITKLTDSETSTQKQTAETSQQKHSSTI